MRLRCSAALLAAAAMLLAGSGTAAPLDLQNGDIISNIEWDSLRLGGGVGSGASYDAGTGILSADGRVTAVNLSAGPSAPAIGLMSSGIELDFDLAFSTETVNVNLPFINVFATLVSPGVGPDVTMRDGGGNILLTLNFASAVSISGVINVLDSGSTLAGVGLLEITGGDANLEAALGGGANIVLTATVFDADPPFNIGLADNTVFNENFVVSLSGVLIPLGTPAPFVPEPSTALLVGGGLLGLLGVSRRARRRS